VVEIFEVVSAVLAILNLEKKYLEPEVLVQSELEEPAAGTLIV